MSQRVLVAGGAGFIGSHLCELLLNKGYQVTAVDNLVTGRKKNIEPLFSRGLKFIEADINVVADFGRFDEIYNLASPASPVDFKKMPLFILTTASLGHRNLLEMAAKHEARILYASTSEVYGDPLVHPQEESYLGNVNTVGHRGCYDEAKRYGEALTMAYHRERRVDTRIARIFNTYGPNMRPDDGRIIPNFFVQALQGQALTVYGQGQQTRSFCYVTDLVAGLFALMNSGETSPVNIGNPVEKTVLEIADRVNALTGNRVAHRYLPLPENDPKQRCPDIRKAESALGWRPKVDLEFGLGECHKFFAAELRASGGRIDAPNV